MKLYRHVSAVMAALVLTGLSYSAGATDINVSSDKAEELLGLSMGSPTQTQPEVKHFEDTLTVNVHGKSLTDAGKSKNVTGIYNGFGSQLTVDKDLVVRLKNDAPASKRELGHYYMSAVYAGYGGKVPRLSKDNPDRDFGDTNIHVKGNVDIDAIGSGLQVNQRGHILVDGGGKIITHPVETSDTYSVVAEEGDVYVNAGADGKHPGTKDLVAVGNVGLINKDYGRDPNHNVEPTNIALAFTTPNSSLTGAVLNEYAESNKNPHNSGADIYLQNGATWNNEWIGMERPTPKKERPSGDNAAYLYKGSKVRNLVGGANPTAAGIIHPIDARPITIQNYSGFVNADYKAGVPASEDGKGQIIIQHAADNSHVMVQGDSAKNLTDDASYRTEMQALANKLQYTGNDKKLAIAVQINEGITRPAAVAELGTDAFDAQGNLVVGNTATVKPVEHHRQVSQRRIFGPCFGQRRKQLFLTGVDLLFQFRMLGGKLFQRPAEYATEPGVDIPKRRLACFQTDKSRHHAAINLTANTFHCPLANVLFVGNQNVTGGSTDNFYQCVRLCACANCAHMAVKRAAGNHHAFRQAETLRPFRA